ncbi:MAG: hypothetical protein U9R42_08485 [Bacteroidota bacterium]|nr:hypothetical protein [Bacteroidota bacterium]
MKYLLSIFLLFINGLLFGQDYTFKSDFKPFKSFNSYDTISTKNWDEPLVKIPINFNFTLLNNIYDSLYVGDGYLGFDCVFFGQLSTCNKYIDVFNNDFIDRYKDNERSKSYILVKHEDSLIIEWQNVGFYEEFYNLKTLNDSLTVQVILKNDNSITIHVGPNLIQDENMIYYGEKGGYFGIWNKLDKTESYMLEGNANSPKLTIGDVGITVIGTPTEGTVYNFYSKDISINQRNNDRIDFKCYQDNNNIYISNLSSNTVNVSFSDVSGKELLNIDKIIPQESLSINKNIFKSNIIIIKCVSKFDCLCRKFIIY